MWWNAKGITDPQLINWTLINYSLISWSTIDWSSDQLFTDQLRNYWLINWWPTNHCWSAGDQLFSYQPMIGGRKSLKKSGEAAVGRRDQFKLLGKTFDQICEIQTSPSPPPPSPLVYGMPYMSSCAWLLLCFFSSYFSQYKQGKREYRTVRNTNKGNCRNWSQHKHGKQIGASCRGSRNWNYLQNTPWIPLEFAFRMPLACASIN